MSQTTVNMTPVAPRVFRRSSGDRIFGGVCGGLGRYWNIDPIILRVAFGVSLLIGGIGVFMYLALWMLVPDDQAPPNVTFTPNWGLRILGWSAAVIAGLIGLDLVAGDALGSGGFVFGAIVAGLIVWIVMSQRNPRPAPDTPEEGGYAYGGAPEDTVYTQTQVLPQPLGPPPPPRPRSYLGLIGLSAAIAAFGLAALLSDNPAVVMGSGLLALGVTLVVGAFAGRARWLLIFAIPLLLLVAATAQVQRTDLSIGDVNWSPTATASTYSMTAGTIDVDFADWDMAPTAADRVSVEMGVGEVRIEAPRNWDLELTTDVGAGGVEIDGRPTSAQTGVQTVTVPASSGQADATIRMTVEVQAGAVIVETGGPAAGPIETPKPALKKKEKAA
ncbi:MAG: PspC domain-containing protein [Candidatus Nanopelagicales bacterium]|nr:PspC domain-containing protein [Micrococcales bacterium]